MRLWNVRRSVALLGLLAAVLISVAVPARAATPTGPGNGLRVSPVRNDITINPGETKTVTINVTNVTASPARFQAVVNDFIGSPDESGNPAIILDPNKFAPKHSLKRFIQPIPNFDLQAGQEKAIAVTIKVPANASGGGYFSAVRFAPASELNDPSQNLSLTGSVGSLILVKVPGDIKEQLSIASFDVRNKDKVNNFFTTNKGIDVVIRFQNGGNIQVAPFGKVLLKNRSGKLLATYEVNASEPRGNVLPDSVRKFTVPLKNIGSFGQFKVEGNFGYGSEGQLLTASTTFYVVPRALVLIFIAIVLLLAFLVFGLPRLIKTYNRRVLRKAGRRY